MILLASTIAKEVKAGNICIDPFDEKQLGYNSYDVRLAPYLARYTKFPLRMDAANPTETWEIPKEGFLLEPGKLYLGATVETATSHKYVPFLDGRSSVGRLGISIHVTAGVGDCGWGGIPGDLTYPTWTLEIMAAEPVVVLPYRRVGQVLFLTPDHEPQPSELYCARGKYNDQKLPQASRMHLDAN